MREGPWDKALAKSKNLRSSSDQYTKAPSVFIYMINYRGRRRKSGWRSLAGCEAPGQTGEKSPGQIGQKPLALGLHVEVPGHNPISVSLSERLSG